MKVFVCDDHDGFWPVGAASAVVAESEDEARRLLDAALVARRLKPYMAAPYTLRELNLEQAGAVILLDGQY